jgi:hypothetical protein
VDKSVQSTRETVICARGGRRRRRPGRRVRSAAAARGAAPPAFGRPWRLDAWRPCLLRSLPLILRRMVFGVATVVGITTAVVTRATAAGAVAAAAAAPQQQAPSAAAGGEPSLWAHLAKFDSTYDCSGKNNTKASGCAPMRPQKTLLECQEYCAQTLTPAGTNCTVFAFQTSATPDKHGLRGCWFRWGSNYTWKDPRDCPPPLRKGCHPSGDTSGCLVGKVKGCTATGSVLRSDGGGDTSQQPPLAALPPMG